MTDVPPEVRAAKPGAIATVVAAVVTTIGSVLVAWITATGVVQQEAPQAVSNEIKNAENEISFLKGEVKKWQEKSDAISSTLELQDKELNDRPAVLYRMSSKNMQVIKPKVLNPIAFDQRIYDTHNATKEVPTWQFHAPKDGIYSVTAYLAFSDETPLLEMALKKKTDNIEGIDRYLTVVRQYPGGNAMVGGSAPIVLRKSNVLTLVATSGAAKDIQVATPGTAWIWVRYEQPIPANWEK